MNQNISRVVVGAPDHVWRVVLLRGHTIRNPVPVKSRKNILRLEIEAEAVLLSNLKLIVRELRVTIF